MTKNEMIAYITNLFGSEHIWTRQIKGLCKVYPSSGYAEILFDQIINSEKKNVLVDIEEKKKELENLQKRLDILQEV